MAAASGVPVPRATAQESRGPQRAPQRHTARPVLQVFVDSTRLSAAAEAELRVAVGSFAKRVGRIMHECCVADSADATEPASVPAVDVDEHQTRLAMWLEHYGEFQVDHTPAATQHSDIVAAAPADMCTPSTAPPDTGVGTSTRPLPNGETAVTDTISLSLSSQASESPPAKRSRAASLLAEIDACLAAHAPTVVEPARSIASTVGIKSMNDNGIDGQRSTPGKRRSRASSARSSAGHSRYMSYGYAPSTASSDNRAAATVDSTTEDLTHGPPAPMTFKPGQLSSALQEALGMTGGSRGPKEAPPYLERMRKLGWPPGWTSQRYNQSLQAWEAVPSIPKTSFPGLAWQAADEAAGTCS